MMGLGGVISSKQREGQGACFCFCWDLPRPRTHGWARVIGRPAYRAGGEAAAAAIGGGGSGPVRFSDNPWILGPKRVWCGRAISTSGGTGILMQGRSGCTDRSIDRSDDDGLVGKFGREKRSEPRKRRRIRRGQLLLLLAALDVCLQDVFLLRYFWIERRLVVVPCLLRSVAETWNLTRHLRILHSFLPLPSILPVFIVSVTDIMIKPDGVQRGLVGEIIKRFEQKGYQLVALKMTMPGKDHMELHYEDLKDKKFFPGLIAYMTSGPVVAMVWEVCIGSCVCIGWCLGTY
jgi:Nucleoside diphosphate kinase